MSVAATLRARTSANYFDATATLSDDTINELVALASEAPSSFNIQHTRFLAVTDRALKTELMGVSFGQAKVRDAAVVFILLGDLRAHEDFITRTRAAAAAGRITAEAAERMCGMAGGFYSNGAMARDEVMRSAGLSAMALMLAAQEMGLVSGPMIGFKPAEVSQLFSIPDRYVPAMMIAVGPAAPGNWPRKPRLNVETLLRINTGSFPA